ncbi:MAG: hypothetical protein DRP64_20990 [Verrucomicrobia bacterium]|nr:MAG: hypothetical protein DRP64_20990 [Verrucomicrobiota bacterium]
MHKTTNRCSACFHSDGARFSQEGPFLGSAGSIGMDTKRGFPQESSDRRMATTLYTYGLESPFSLGFLRVFEDQSS